MERAFYAPSLTLRKTTWLIVHRVFGLDEMIVSFWSPCGQWAAAHKRERMQTVQSDGRLLRESSEMSAEIWKSDGHFDGNDERNIWKKKAQPKDKRQTTRSRAGLLKCFSRWIPEYVCVSVVGVWCPVYCLNVSLFSSKRDLCTCLSCPLCRVSPFFYFSLAPSSEKLVRAFSLKQSWKPADWLERLKWAG